MNALIHRPGIAKTLRYLAAYAWFVFFILLGIAITWCLRSDILILCLLFPMEHWLSNLIERWGIFIMLIPWILTIPALEPYMNAAVRKGLVLRRARKVLAIEGILGLVAVLVMGIEALNGYLPIL